MPGQLDSVLRPVAERLIEQFGGAIQYRQVTRAYSASTGKTTESETALSVIGTPPEPYNESRIDGTVVQVGDISTLIKALNLGFTPEVGDKVTFNAETWQVVGVTPIYSGALPAAYELQLRQ